MKCEATINVIGRFLGPRFLFVFMFCLVVLVLVFCLTSDSMVFIDLPKSDIASVSGLSMGSHLSDA